MKTVLATRTVEIPDGGTFDDIKAWGLKLDRNILLTVVAFR
jgi:hypothetical protein